MTGLIYFPHLPATSESVLSHHRHQGIGGVTIHTHTHTRCRLSHILEQWVGRNRGQMHVCVCVGGVEIPSRPEGVWSESGTSTIAN